MKLEMFNDNIMSWFTKSGFTIWNKSKMYVNEILQVFDFSQYFLQIIFCLKSFGKWKFFKRKIKEKDRQFIYHIFVQVFWIFVQYEQSHDMLQKSYFLA